MVCYVLDKTPFKLVRDDYEFYFSSQYNLKRFLNKEEEEIKRISVSLSNRFKFHIEANDLARISLYSKVESRGFLIKYKGIDFQCLRI